MVVLEQIDPWPHGQIVGTSHQVERIVIEPDRPRRFHHGRGHRERAIHATQWKRSTMSAFLQNQVALEVLDAASHCFVELGRRRIEWVPSLKRMTRIVDEH